MSRYILTFLFLIPWLNPSALSSQPSMSPMSADATNKETNKETHKPPSTHKSTKSCNKSKRGSPNSSPKPSPKFTPNQSPKPISFRSNPKFNKSKSKDIQHGFNLNMAIRCFFSPGTVVGIFSLSFVI